VEKVRQAKKPIGRDQRRRHDQRIPEEGKNALDTREQDYKQDRKYEMG
jgi:hypothetical protein